MILFRIVAVFGGLLGGFPRRQPCLSACLLRLAHVGQKTAPATGAHQPLPIFHELGLSFASLDFGALLIQPPLLVRIYSALLRQLLRLEG